MSDASHPREHGPQPIDALLDELGLNNHDLVDASTEQLTHKQIQKARRGRRVTENIQKKILAALQTVADSSSGREFILEDLFTY